MPKDKDKHSSIKEKQPSASRSKRRSDDEECSQQQEVVAVINDSAPVSKLKTSRRSDPASHKDDNSQTTFECTYIIFTHRHQVLLHKHHLVKVMLGMSLLRTWIQSLMLLLEI